MHLHNGAAEPTEQDMTARRGEVARASRAGRSGRRGEHPPPEGARSAPRWSAAPDAGPRLPAAAPAAVRLERIGTLAAARAAWTALAVAGGNPFGTWEWADAWWRVNGEGRELFVHAVRDPDGRVAAVLPLYRARKGPLGLVRFLGHGAADQAGPVCAPADLPLAARGLGALAGRLAPREVLLAERLPGEEALPARMAGRLIRRESTPLLDIAGRSWNEWLANRSPNFRQQVRRRERKVVREHDLRFRLTTDPATLDADVTALIALHGQRWSEGQSSAFAPTREAFHRDFAHRALERGWLRLWTAEIGGRPVASWYGLRFAGREWYYQAGRDPRWDGYAVGFVLLAHTIRAAFDDGMREYRFGLGDEPYKERFASADPQLDTMVLGDRALVSAVAAGAGVAHRLPAQRRRQLLSVLG